MRNMLMAAGVIVALGAAGGAYTYVRETNTVCGEDRYIDSVYNIKGGNEITILGSMFSEFKKQSTYYKALEAAVENGEAEASTLETLVADFDAAEVHVRQVHPSNNSLLTCRLVKNFGDFKMSSRFQIRFDTVTGAEFGELYEKRRSHILLNPIAEGDLLETVDVALIRREEFTLERDKRWQGINMDTSYVAPTDIADVSLRSIAK